MSNLVKLWIAANKEHISGDSVDEHLLPSDSIVAESQKDPTDISLDLSIVYHTQWIEKVHHAFINQDVDWLLT